SLLGRSDQGGWVAFAAGAFFHRDLFAGDFLDSPNDFAHGIALASSQVVMESRAWLEFFQDEEMSVRQVIDMNIVANTGPVGGWIVGAENLDVRTLPKDGLND